VVRRRCSTPGESPEDLQLIVALNSRVLIEQAKGILAERLRVSPGEAFLILRRYARDHNHPLTTLAGDVIRGTARIAPAKQQDSGPRRPRHDHTMEEAELAEFLDQRAHLRSPSPSRR